MRKKHHSEWTTEEHQAAWGKPVPVENAWVLSVEELARARAIATPSLGSKTVCRCCGCWIPSGDAGRVRFRIQRADATHIWKSGFLHGSCEKTADQLQAESDGEQIEAIAAQDLEEWERENPQPKSSDEPGFNLFVHPEPKRKR